MKFSNETRQALKGIRMMKSTEPRKPTMHFLKAWPHWYYLIVHRQMQFNLHRNDDRDFQVGDIIIFQEYDPDAKRYTNNEGKAIITGIHRDIPGLMPNYSAMDILFIGKLVKHGDDAKVDLNNIN